MKRTLVAAGHRFGLFVAFLALTMLTALTARPASAVTFITASGPFVLNKPHETYYLATNLKFKGNGLEITADGVDLELAGKTISGTPSILDGPPPETVGILVFLASSVTIRGGRIADFTTNVEVINGTSCKLYSLNTSHATDTITTRRGIFLNNCSFDFVLGCFANGCQEGIRVEGDHNIIQSNTTDQCSPFGIVLYGASANVVRGNSTNGCFKAGIALLPVAENNTVTGNTSTHNGNGVFLDAGANQNLIQGNFCLNNSNGIWVEDQAGFNRIAANVALRNAVFDLNDFNRSCDHNVWAANRVLPGVTANQPCIH